MLALARRRSPAATTERARSEERADVSG
jgi:hypothetical protein